ncbi:MAG: hypothetical protein RLZZ522_166 [Verrucomicrobiota bacterium]|jgi:hypothetical protein
MNAFPAGRRRRRALIAVLGVLALAAAAWLLREYGRVGWLPGCLFHRFTGLHCPGCGMTRGTVAVLHGEFGRAFRHNPVGMVLLPLAMAGLALELAGWVRGRPLRWRLAVGRWGGWVIVWTFLAFFLLRNLPWWPFTLLAPP